MKKPTKRRRSSKRRPDLLQKSWFWLMLLAFAGLVIFGLVFLARINETPAPPTVAGSPAVPASVVDRAALRTVVEDFLAATWPEISRLPQTLDQDPYRYTVVGELPAEKVLEGLRARLRIFPGRFLVTLSEDAVLAVVSEGREQLVVQFVVPVPEKPAPLPVAMPKGPLVTIIMDDLGRSVHQAKALLSLAQLVTFAILPSEEHAARVAEMGHAAGREIMLHVPMEPQGYPALNPGSDALFVQFDDAEIRRRFDELLASIPHAVGVNNHMGSRFTESARALSPVMASLHEKGLFFVDSLTTGRSQVTATAHQHGVPTIERDVFLDNVAEVAAISREIRRLEALARRQGMAIGICHPYPETLEALKRELPGLAARGIIMVPVSVLLKKKANDQGS